MADALRIRSKSGSSKGLNLKLAATAPAKELTVARVNTRGPKVALQIQDAAAAQSAQQKALGRLKQYPERRLALKKLWIDINGKGPGVCKVCSQQCRGHFSRGRRSTGGYQDLPGLHD